MKTALIGFVFLVAALMAPSIAAAQQTDLKGTWSGNWMPKGGVPDSVTVELRQDSAGNVTGKFLTPKQVEFSKATFNPKTRALLVEAADPSGKIYKIDGKVEGTELKGTLQIDQTTGEVRLIKWTYFGR